MGRPPLGPWRAVSSRIQVGTPICPAPLFKSFIGACVNGANSTGGKKPVRGPMPQARARAAFRLLLCAAAFLLASGCSFDYGANSAVEAFEGPSAVFYGFSHTVVVKGKSSSSSSRPRRPRPMISDRNGPSSMPASFIEFDRVSGKPSSTGVAEDAVFHSRNRGAPSSRAPSRSTPSGRTRS